MYTTIKSIKKWLIDFYIKALENTHSTIILYDADH